MVQLCGVCECLHVGFIELKCKEDFTTLCVGVCVCMSVCVRESVHVCGVCVAHPM